jgi:hypothetical protein
MKVGSRLTVMADAAAEKSVVTIVFLEGRGAREHDIAR